MAENITLGVNTSDAQKKLDDLGQAVDDTAQKIDQMASKPVKLDTSYSVKQLQDMADAVNAFVQQIGQKAGKPVKVLNVSDNADELKQLMADYQEVIRMSTTVRGPLNQVGQGPGNRPATPLNVDQVLRQNTNYMQATMSRLLQHNANSSAKPVDVGLDYHELTGRVKPAPGQDLNPPPVPRQEDGKFNRFITQATQGFGAGGVAGGTVASFARGAGQASDSGLGAMGILKGGGVAALAYGAFQAVSAGVGAVSDKMDAGKQENIEIDKFRRSLGSTADSFSDLKNKSRAVGEQFALTYDESRKLTTEFASLAKVNATGQAAAGIDLARATGVDESQGVSFMATMRRSGSLSEKTADAKLLSIQFAEALKRTGSTLNAGDLMGAMGNFASTTAQRSLGAANVEGFAGLLSALVGSGTPGLQGNVGNAANLLNRADAAFQGGGGMGEASNTLQFMAMKGDEVGLLGIRQRQAAGMYATADDVFGEKDGQVNQVNKYLGNGGMSRFKGNKMGVEEVLDLFDRQGLSKETQLLSASNHFKMNPQEMATLMNMRNEGKLDVLKGMFDKYKDSVADPTKLSSHGFMALADIGEAKGNVGKLSALRESMAKREGLTDEQRAGLNAAKTMTDPVKLEAALVNVAKTFEREKTQGEQAQATAAKLSNDTARMADGLIPLAQKSKDLLADLVNYFAPNSPSLQSAKMDAQDVALKDASLPDASSDQKIAASNVMKSRAYPYADHIKNAEQKLGLESGEMAGLIEQESRFRPDVFSEVKDKEGKSTSAYGLTQMTTAAITDATPTFRKMFGRDPYLEPKTSPTDGKTRNVPTVPWEQIYLGAIYKRMKNDQTGSVEGGNAAYYGGYGGRNNPDAIAYNKQVRARQKKYKTDFDPELLGKKPESLGVVSAKFGIGKPVNTIKPGGVPEQNVSPEKNDSPTPKTTALSAKPAAAPKEAAVTSLSAKPVDAPKEAAKAAPVQIPYAESVSKSMAPQSQKFDFNSPTANIVVRVESADGLRAQTQEFAQSMVFKPLAAGTKPWQSLVQ